MVAKLTEESYCSLLDELLRYYLHIGNMHPTEKMSINIARKYIERTRYSFDEIIAKTRVKLRSSDFVFEDRLTHRERNVFVLHFEIFIVHVVRVIEYINGTVKQL